MTWIKEQAQPDRKTYHAIKCFTCGRVLPSRSYLKHHMNHDVRYIDKNGAPIE